MVLRGECVHEGISELRAAMSRRALLAITLMLCTSPAWAQWTFSLHPAQAREQAEVRLRVDDASGCFPSNVPTILRAAGTVTFTAEINDSLPPGTPPGGCPAAWVTPRFFSLGSFAPGTYEVRAITCSNAPGPEPCTLQARLALAVNATRDVNAIPLMSGAVALLCAALIALVAARFTHEPA